MRTIDNLKKNKKKKVAFKKRLKDYRASRKIKITTIWQINLRKKAPNLTTKKKRMVILKMRLKVYKSFRNLKPSSLIKSMILVTSPINNRKVVNLKN